VNNSLDGRSQKLLTPLLSWLLKWRSGCKWMPAVKDSLVTLHEEGGRNRTIPSPPLDNAGIPRYNSNHHEHTILHAFQIFKTWQPKRPLSQDQEDSPYMGGIAAHRPIYS